MKAKISDIITKTDTYGGKLFNIVLFLLITISTIAVMLESVKSIRTEYNFTLNIIEYTITSIFLAEYLLRIYISRSKIKYIFSFYGLIDFISIIPSLISYFFFDIQSLLIIRSIRMLRVFRVLKIAQFLGEELNLIRSLKKSIPKIIVFLLGVSIIIIIFGSFMYLIEGEENGFTSIPKSIYWAIVTMTTVGYGDIAPKTVIGQILSSTIMLIGYGIIAVPTGIVVSNYNKKKIICNNCQKQTLLNSQTNFCYFCGVKFTFNKSKK